MSMTMMAMKMMMMMMMVMMVMILMVMILMVIMMAVMLMMIMVLEMITMMSRIIAYGALVPGSGQSCYVVKVYKIKSLQGQHVSATCLLILLVVSS